MIQVCRGSPADKTADSSGDAEGWLRRRQGCHVTAAARARGPRKAQEPRAGFQNAQSGGSRETPQRSGATAGHGTGRKRSVAGSGPAEGLGRDCRAPTVDPVRTGKQFQGFRERPTEGGARKQRRREGRGAASALQSLSVPRATSGRASRDGHREAEHRPQRSLAPSETPCQRC